MKWFMVLVGFCFTEFYRFVPEYETIRIRKNKTRHHTILEQNLSAVNWNIISR